MSEEIVQPDAGVPAEGQGNTAPYSEYLDKLPEDIRGDVEPVFQEWDSNVTKRFQEAADYKKQWEPFQDLGLNDVPKEDVESLLALRDLAANDPEQFDTWLRETATERGLFEDAPNDQFDPYAEPDDDAALSQKLDPMMSELQEMKQWREQMEQDSRISEAMKTVEAQVEEQSAKHPDVPKDLAEQFLASFAESDPQNAVQLAYDAAEKWMVQIQQNMVAGKLAQPESAEQGSTPDGNPQAITSFKDAQAQVLARLKQN